MQCSETLLGPSSSRHKEHKGSHFPYPAGAHPACPYPILSCVTLGSAFMAKGMPVMITPRPARSEKSRPSLT